MTLIAEKLRSVQQRIAAAAKGREITLLAVSKTRSAAEIAELAALGQRHFGENYVQEALAKQAELASADVCWHFIGPIQSNKCRDIAGHFDWAHGVDREKLLKALSRHREGDEPLNICLQVNIDDEASKSGCQPEELAALAALAGALPGLRLRGLMAIPHPWPEAERRQAAFMRMAQLFESLRAQHPEMDTLSLGMSDDFEMAIAEGSTLVRIGSALFGPRAPRDASASVSVSVSTPNS